MHISSVISHACCSNNRLCMQMSSMQKAWQLAETIIHCFTAPRRLTFTHRFRFYY